uniref:Uncharacterized protein n=1 Tax=Setaria italica TaxID=4555 RepID=K3YNZ2_SETIT
MPERKQLVNGNGQMALGLFLPQLVKGMES